MLSVMARGFVFDLFAVKTFERLSGVGSFIELLRESLPLVEERHREYLVKEAAHYEMDSDEYQMESMILDERFQHWFPRLSEYSAIILLQSAVETRLFACAERVGHRTSSTIQPRDMLKGRAATAAVSARYLTEIGNIRVKSDPAWETLKDLESLRNLIVHRGGERGTTDAHQEAFDRLLKKYDPHLSESESPSKAHTSVRVSLDFCSAMVDEVANFFGRVLLQLGVKREAIPSKYRPRRVKPRAGRRTATASD
jgi:hypothetical protein